MWEGVHEEFACRAEIRCFVVMVSTPQREPTNEGGVRGFLKCHLEASESLAIEEGREGPEEVLRPHAPCVTGKSARAQCWLRVPSILGNEQPIAVWNVAVFRECVHDFLAELDGQDTGLHGGRNGDRVWRDPVTEPCIGWMLDELANMMRDLGGIKVDVRNAGRLSIR